AIHEIEALQKIGDTSIETAVLLGECERLAGRPSDAMPVLQQAVDRDARNPDAYVALGRAQVAGHQRRAGAESFNRALAIAPDDAEALDALADLAIEAGDLASARGRLEALRARDPEDQAVAVKLGTVLARSGEL